MTEPRFYAKSRPLGLYGHLVHDRDNSDRVVALAETREWADEIAAGLNCRHEARIAMAEDPAP